MVFRVAEPDGQNRIDKPYNGHTIFCRLFFGHCSREILNNRDRSHHDYARILCFVAEHDGPPVPAKYDVG